MVVYLVEFTSKLFLLAAIVYLLYRVFSNRNRKDEVLLAAGYITGFEVFLRMTGGAFSYEFAKYAVMGFLMIGFFYRGFHRKSWSYIFYILLLVPGILFSAINLNYESNIANAIGFNLSGPICLAISALYCYDRKMPSQRFQQILLAVLLPIVTMTAYLYVFTPNIRDALSGTQSNFQTSGGFGPNQVATVLGLGMFILFSRFFIIKNRLVNIIDLTLLAFISYRAIVTFSRGGVLTAAACAVVFFIVYFSRSQGREKAKLISKMMVVGVVIITTWLITSVFTLGLIDKRYSNQNAAGELKQDITAGRAELLESELDAFFNNPFTGIGVGKMKEYRMEKTGRVSATHNEVSRLLSEHGMFGLLSLMVLILTPLLFRMKNKSNFYLYSFFIFWLLTISHSSMRIAAPAFVYGLALLNIIYAKQKPVIHRK